MEHMRATAAMQERNPRGGALDADWPQTPVGQFAFETDAFFSDVYCC